MISHIGGNLTHSSSLLGSMSCNPMEQATLVSGEIKKTEWVIVLICRRRQWRHVLFCSSQSLENRREERDRSSVICRHFCRITLRRNKLPTLWSVHLFFSPQSHSHYRLDHSRWHLDALFSDQGKGFDAITQRICLFISKLITNTKWHFTRNV